MYWTFNGTDTAFLSFPVSVTGVEQTFTVDLTTEAGEALSGVFLFVPTLSLAGVVKAKRSGESSFKDIGYYLDSSCSLGDIPAATTVSIDFSLTTPVGVGDGLLSIPIMIGFGEFHPVSSDQWDTDNLLWSENTPDLWE